MHITEQMVESIYLMELSAAREDYADEGTYRRDLQKAEDRRRNALGRLRNCPHTTQGSGHAVPDVRRTRR